MVYTLKEQISLLPHYLEKFFNFYISSSLKAFLSEVVKGFAFFFPWSCFLDCIKTEVHPEIHW